MMLTENNRTEIKGNVTNTIALSRPEDSFSFSSLTERNIDGYVICPIEQIDEAKELILKIRNYKEIYNERTIKEIQKNN